MGPLPPGPLDVFVTLVAAAPELGADGPRAEVSAHDLAALLGFGAARLGRVLSFVEAYSTAFVSETEGTRGLFRAVWLAGLVALGQRPLTECGLERSSNYP